MDRNHLSRAFPWLAAALLVITLAAAGGAAWLRWGAARPSGAEPLTAATTTAATPAATAAPSDPGPPPSSAPPTGTATPATTATPAATATPSATPQPSEYIVQSGDTLGAIAASFGLTAEELAAYNDLPNPDLIDVGTVLRLPPAADATPLPSPAASTSATPAAGVTPAADATPAAGATTAPSSSTPSAVATIGASYGGRPIEHYVFGDGPAHVAFVGAIHGGYEWNTANLAYAMIDYFEGNPAAVPAEVTLHIIPVANPDGLARVAPGWQTGPIPTPAGVISDTFTGRFNGRDVDLNRNWDCNWQPTGVWRDQVVDAGLTVFSEPETVALRDFFLALPVEAVVFWHSAVGTVLAGTCAPEGHASSRALAEVYANAAGYPLQTPLGYEINGDASDWLTTQDIPSIAIELTDHSRIEWDRNLAGTLAVLRFYAASCAGGACGGSDR